MFRIPTTLFVLCLASVVDTSDVQRSFYICPGRTLFTNTGGLADLAPPPDVFLAVVQQRGAKSSHLGPQQRLEIVRYVDGEFAHVVKPIPAGRKGYHFEVGKPIDEKSLTQAVANNGAAASPGDTIQITRLDFREKEIVVEINGGGRRKFRLRDHLQIGIGNPYPTSTTVSSAPTARNPVGATIILDYGRPLPNMSPDDLKKDLGPLLDFSREHSAAVNWIDTLPPEFKQGVQDHRAVVGMDREMVIAALGRPDHKVRERNEQGDETEDWIFGEPPARTTFVTFRGDRVIRVRVFNDAR